jgi:predicted nicotinamide N-methyase
MEAPTEDSVEIATNTSIRSYTRTVNSSPAGAVTTLSVSLEAVKSSSLCFGVDQPCTGHAVWFAADNLSNFLHDHHHAFRTQHQRPLRVLELGAGPGLAGIWLAKLLQGGDDHTVATFLMTDGDEQVVNLLRRNCQRNMLRESHDDFTIRHYHSNVTVQCQHFLWGKLEAEQLLLQGAGFDLILGADLIYGRSDDANSCTGTLVADLFDTVFMLLLNDAAVFYLGFTRRDLPIESVLETANQRGLIWELQEDYVYDIFDTNTDGQTCFWRDAIYSFGRGDGAAQSQQTRLQQELMANEG